jgi:hypothetical protein
VMVLMLKHQAHTDEDVVGAEGRWWHIRHDMYIKINILEPTPKCKRDKAVQSQHPLKVRSIR